MTPCFIVRTTPKVERLLKNLAKRHADLPERFAEAIEILKVDPPITSAGRTPSKSWKPSRQAKASIGCGLAAGAFGITLPARTSCSNTAVSEEKIRIARAASDLWLKWRLEVL